MRNSFIIFLLLTQTAFSQQGAGVRVSTASKNVHIIDTAFSIPQLGRVRRIWIYLPEDASQKKYPVIYMHDGQNLFDDTSSYAGEWGVDEMMDSVQGQKAIVVGIDNGREYRLPEYLPYPHEKYGKAEGKEYVQFIVKTLKPWIDRHYRTLKDRKHTFIAGSSLGGLISVYAMLQYPKVFGGAGIFSSAFWIAPPIMDEIQKKGRKLKARIFFYAGKQEDETMVANTLKAMEIFDRVSKSVFRTVIREEGKHNEHSWRRELAGFYQFIINN